VSPRALLLELRRRGVRLRAEGERLLVEADPGVLTPRDREALSREKDAVLCRLRAEAAWEGTVQEVGERQRKAAGPPPDGAEDLRLQERLGAALERAWTPEGLEGARRLMAEWRRLWLGATAEDHVAFQARLRRLSLAELFDIAHDPALPDEEREAARREVLERGREMVRAAEEARVGGAVAGAVDGGGGSGRARGGTQ
jgi:hypothetical protein